MDEAPKLEPCSDTVDWDHPDDPENPRNWSASKSYGHVVIISAMCMVV